MPVKAETRWSSAMRRNKVSWRAQWSLWTIRSLSSRSERTSSSNSSTSVKRRRPFQSSGPNKARTLTPPITSSQTKMQSAKLKTCRLYSWKRSSLNTRLWRANLSIPSTVWLSGTPGLLPLEDNRLSASRTSRFQGRVIRIMRRKTKRQKPS